MHGACVIYKNARYYGPGDIRVEDIAEPVASNGQVKVKIAWNGICGSDLHAYLSPIPIYANSVPNELTGETAPVTLGHEFSGTIVALGPGVDQSKWTVGTNVVVEPVISCMKVDTCHACASGSRNLCRKCNFIGICGWGGGLSEFIALDTKYLHVLPQGIPLEIGACIEPLAVAWHAIKRSGFSAGKSVLILGAGPIGLFILKILRSFDPSATIVMSEPTVLRRQQALKNGATLSLDPLSVDVPEAVTKATGGIGVDIAFDAAGIQASLDTALHSVRPRGTVVNVAVWEKTATVDVNLFWTKEIFLTGSAAYDRVHPELLEAVAAGKIPGIEDLITRRIALEDVVEKGFKALLHNKDAHIKILVRPSGNEKSKL
ncbi:(R,R)-butanediol dehydrogenase [Termitomyces sp. T112]|nr:(R,R)-butanediol dehydrogenase [Termitomyces sp. T112]